MKSFYDNLIFVVLATVLSISPLQAIAASVSDCLGTDKNMHHSLSNSKIDTTKHHSNHASHQQVTKVTTQQDCCETIACDMTHCAGFVAIAITADIQNDIIYTLSEAYVKPSELLLQSFPSSLYRPPKA